MTYHNNNLNVTTCSCICICISIFISILFVYTHNNINTHTKLLTINETSQKYDIYKYKFNKYRNKLQKIYGGGGENICKSIQKTTENLSTNIPALNDELHTLTSDLKIIKQEFEKRKYTLNEQINALNGQLRQEQKENKESQPTVTITEFNPSIYKIRINWAFLKENSKPPEPTKQVVNVLNVAFNETPSSGYANAYMFADTPEQVVHKHFDWWLFPWDQDSQHGNEYTLTEKDMEWILTNVKIMYKNKWIPYSEMYKLTIKIIQASVPVRLVKIIYSTILFIEAAKTNSENLHNLMIVARFIVALCDTNKPPNFIFQRKSVKDRSVTDGIEILREYVTKYEK